ncbi:efflux RND transporter periplasmic adaptor subunit [Marinibacterium sp. SX1]|uniref:efflux RND transporter periplasmic adaptor subunit n=1 Tax=Marinibacterium sp. SX1 TaxID=3388424 RepID=UPI003D16AFD2
MRLIPTLTALVVTVALYFLVLERDKLLAFARGTDPATEATQDGADAPAGDTGIAQDNSAENMKTAADAAVPGDDTPPAMGVVVRRSVAQPVDSAVILRGETQAMREVAVPAETSAVVMSEPLRKGARVEEGQELCVLDPGTRHVTLADAKAQLSLAQSRIPESEARRIEAEAVLEQARIDLNAAQKLSEGGYASDIRLAGARATIRSAEAAVAAAEAGLESAQTGIESAQAQVAFAEKEIERLTIRAPFAGYLESDTAELGSFLAAGGICGTVIQLDPMKLVGYVPETQVNRVSMGATATARLADGGAAEGTVSFISRSADPVTRTFSVEVSVDNADLAIRDGQTAEIAVASEGTRAHRLPQSALTLNNDGKLGVRIVDWEGIVQFQPITVLRDDVDGIWVTGPTEEADVIVVGQDFVTAGLKVAVSYEDESDGEDQP